MPTKKLTLVQKLEVVDDTARSGNVRQIAAKWKVRPSTICKWWKNYEQIKQERERSPRKLTTYRGPKCQNEELELSLYNWVLAECREENSVSKSDIVDKALSLNPDIKSANQITVTNWVYRFIKRRGFSLRTRTRVSQITNAVMQPVRRDYCRRLMNSNRNRINDPRYLINMDETAVFLNCAPNCTVHVKGEKTVSVMIGSASSMRFTLAVSAAMDGRKLPLFFYIQRQAKWINREATSTNNSCWNCWLRASKGLDGRQDNAHLVRICL